MLRKLCKGQRLKDEKNPLSLTELFKNDYNIAATEEKDIQYFFTLYKSFSKQIFRHLTLKALKLDKNLLCDRNVETRMDGPEFGN